MTVIDSATDWIEICSVLETRVDLVANQVEVAWLTRYPLPCEIIVDKGEELLAELKIMIVNDYRIPCNSVSAPNPQANIIVERVHQTIGNIICTFLIQQMAIMRTPGKTVSHLLYLPYGL